MRCRTATPAGFSPYRRVAHSFSYRAVRPGVVWSWLLSAKKPNDRSEALCAHCRIFDCGATNALAAEDIFTTELAIKSLLTSSWAWTTSEHATGYGAHASSLDLHAGRRQSRRPQVSQRNNIATTSWRPLAACTHARPAAEAERSPALAMADADAQMQGGASGGRFVRVRARVARGSSKRRASIGRRGWWTHDRRARDVHGRFGPAATRLPGRVSPGRARVPRGTAGRPLRTSSLPAHDNAHGMFSVDRECSWPPMDLQRTANSLAGTTADGWLRTGMYSLCGLWAGYGGMVEATYSYTTTRGNGIYRHSANSGESNLRLSDIPISSPLRRRRTPKENGSGGLALTCAASRRCRPPPWRTSPRARRAAADCGRAARPGPSACPPRPRRPGRRSSRRARASRRGPLCGGSPRSRRRPPRSAGPSAWCAGARARARSTRARRCRRQGPRCACSSGRARRSGTRPRAPRTACRTGPGRRRHRCGARPRTCTGPGSGRAASRTRACLRRTWTQARSSGATGTWRAPRRANGTRARCWARSARHSRASGRAWRGYGWRWTWLWSWTSVATAKE